MRPNELSGKLTLMTYLKALDGATAFELRLGDSPSVRNCKIALYVAGVGYRIAVCLSGAGNELIYLTDEALLQTSNATYIVQVSKKVLTCCHCGLSLSRG